MHHFAMFCVLEQMQLSFDATVHVVFGCYAMRFPLCLEILSLSKQNPWKLFSTRSFEYTENTHETLTHTQWMTRFYNVWSDASRKVLFSRLNESLCLPLPQSQMKRRNFIESRIHFCHIILEHHHCHIQQLSTKHTYNRHRMQVINWISKI